MKLKMRYFINCHKTLTPMVILTLMIRHQNFEIGPVIYLALHGNYCINWLLKESIFPDKSFEEELTPLWFILGFVGLNQYWWTPWILVRKQTDPMNATIFLAVTCNIIGTFLHFCSDAQKYFMLKEKKRLITTDFFARSRNVNYLGEILTYFGFAIMAEHAVPILILVTMSVFVYLPNMLKKDKSLSKYESFETYKQQTNMLLPKF